MASLIYNTNRAAGAQPLGPHDFFVRDAEQAQADRDALEIAKLKVWAIAHNAGQKAKGKAPSS